MHRSLAYIDAALNELPQAEPGTQASRDLAAIRDALFRARTRLTLLQRRTTTVVSELRSDRAA